MLYIVQWDIVPTLELYPKRPASRREYSVETNSYNCFNLLLPQHEDLHRTLSNGLLTSTDRKHTRNTLQKRRRLFFKKLVPHVLGATHHPSFSNNFAHEILIILPHPPPHQSCSDVIKVYSLLLVQYISIPTTKCREDFFLEIQRRQLLFTVNIFESWSWYFF